MMLVALMTAGSAYAEGATTKRVTKSVKVEQTVTEVSSTGEVTGTATTEAGHGTVSVAPTAEQAEQAFQAARRSFMAVASGGADVKPGDIVQTPTGAENQLAGGMPQNIALEDIRIVMDVDNVTLREVMTKIVQQAANYTGPWTVKWRLKPENLAIMDERVNLTTEANFGEFCNLLTERVKNMTGTQLFVTAFPGTRMLLIADTYY